MQQRIPVEELPSGPRAAVLAFDARLERGPLRVRALWADAQTRGLGKRVRALRRRRFAVRVAGIVAVSAALFALVHWWR